jgi:chromosome segregation ATPase
MQTQQVFSTEHTKLKIEGVKMEKTIEVMGPEIKRLSNIISANNDRIGTQQESIRKLANKAQKFRSNEESLTESIKRLEDKLVDTQKHVNKQLVDAVSTLETRHETLQVGIVNLEKKQSNLRDSVDNEISSEKDKLTKLRVQAEKLNAEAKKLNTLANQKYNSMGDIMKENEAVKKQMAESKAKHALAIADLQDKQKEVNSLKSDYENKSKNLVSNELIAEKSIRSATERSKNVTMREVAVKNETEELAKKMTDIESSTETLLKDREKISKRNEQLEDEAKTVEKNKKALESERKDLEYKVLRFQKLLKEKKIDEGLLDG